MRYVLTKDFTKINVAAGLFQNVSGDAHIEITNDISQQGIILKPWQTVNIAATVYARRLSGGGTCALAVLPFTETANAEENSDGETTNTETPATDTTSQTSDYYNFPAPPPKPPMNPFYGGNIFDGKPGHKPHFPPPHFPPKKDEGLTIKIPPEALANGQTKFIVELPDRKKG